ncbi:MAG: hypothetical protein Q4P78_05915 [Rothia sp. (in: high G+C Gram-positive bacteria)]|uniref:hypothetical protein n=1 Tax=Rothia sp. (in: high G+C Gram-positive bacteria) TaxID=1885016 RepID=UPI0026DF7627|nr:hypothetical protein [Rothia sp. (in: high G+C Gram-positive bacteria)]MDO5750725.1 hypothetical protein [Rothia sp. (in: high G+C Gram-positive bacteria)]
MSGLLVPTKKLPFMFYYGLLIFLFMASLSTFITVSNGIYKRDILFSGSVFLEILYYISIAVSSSLSLAYIYLLRNISQKFMVCAAIPTGLIIGIAFRFPDMWGYGIGCTANFWMIFGILPMAWIHPKAYEEYPERYRGGSEE